MKYMIIVFCLWATCFACEKDTSTNTTTTEEVSTEVVPTKKSSTSSLPLAEKIYVSHFKPVQFKIPATSKSVEDDRSISIDFPSQDISVAGSLTERVVVYVDDPCNNADWSTLSSSDKGKITPTGSEDFGGITYYTGTEDFGGTQNRIERRWYRTEVEGACISFAFQTRYISGELQEATPAGNGKYYPLEDLTALILSSVRAPFTGYWQLPGGNASLDISRSGRNYTILWKDNKQQHKIDGHLSAGKLIGDFGGIIQNFSLQPITSTQIGLTIEPNPKGDMIMNLSFEKSTKE